jgi:hypothetical protein
MVLFPREGTSLAPDEINSLAINENSACDGETPWVCCPKPLQGANKIRVRSTHRDEGRMLS